jgi:hypothetical protein
MSLDTPFFVAAVWLGSLFAYSGALKLVFGRAQNLRAIAGYKILPERHTTIAAALLPWVEIAIGALLLLTPYSVAAASAAIVFGSVFAVATASVLARGIETSCGCAGKASDPVTRLTMVRAGLIVLAGVTVVFAGISIPSVVGAPVLGFALAPGALLYARQVRHRRTHGREHDHEHAQPHGALLGSEAATMVSQIGGGSSASSR